MLFFSAFQSVSTTAHAAQDAGSAPQGAATPACDPWAVTELPDKSAYMVNNAYEKPEAASLCHELSSKTSWGSSWDHYGLTGGMAAQLQVGKWPWSEVNTAGSELPRQIDDGAKTYSRWAYDKQITAGTDWNMFWEIWLHSDSSASSSSITADIMIHPAYGSKGGEYQATVELSGARWEVWKHTHPSGFPLVHYYRVDQTDTPGTLELSAFWLDSAERGWGGKSDWLGSVTAGQESYSGAGSFETYDWDLWFDGANEPEARTDS
ncbi:MAG: hypothetical protein ACRCYU_01205 [Nocardioides sp.]